MARVPYGTGPYSRISAFAPIFAGDVILAPKVDFVGNLVPVVSFSANLGKVNPLSGNLAPAISFAADLDVHVNLIDFVGGIAPQIALGGLLSLDLPLTALEGSFGFTVVYGASAFVSGPLWEASAPVAPPWAPSEPCPPSMWTPVDPCDPVTWEKSELCNG